MTFQNLDNTQPDLIIGGKRSLVSAQSGNGISTVIGTPRNYYSKANYKTTGNFGFGASCCVYTAYTTMGPFTSYVGYVTQNDANSVWIVLSPPYRSASSLPLRYKAVGAADSTLANAIFPITNTYPTNDSNYTYQSYEMLMRIVSYFIGSNAPNAATTAIPFIYDSSVGFNTTTNAYGPLVANGPIVYGQVTYLSTL
ncbi:MAG: hypothetical protein EOP45_18445 [Sphingobacteriaceae bacterium]|nr:MAG: hypothetical protein EOP45_18445 [Sphingobacteriaceae bacterium]